MRMPSSSSTSATTYAVLEPRELRVPRLHRSCTTTPRPDDSTGVQPSDRQCGHIGRGGWRSTPQPSQRWISSRCSRSPSQKNCVSGVTVGPSRSGSAVLTPSPSGLNFRMRNVCVPTTSPAPSR